MLQLLGLIPEDLPTLKRELVIALFYNAFPLHQFARKVLPVLPEEEVMELGRRLGWLNFISVGEQ